MCSCNGMAARSIKRMPGTVFIFVILLSGFRGTSSLAADSTGDKHKSDGSSESLVQEGTPVLWRDPTDISSRDVFYGPGGKEHATLVEEDPNGTNSKIVVRDQDGVKWTVKPGREARAETAASRLTWAVGYFANEDYVLHDLNVENLPSRLHRGQKFFASDGDE
jgi:hypothetical protein